MEAMTFDQYYAHFEDFWGKIPQWDDVKAVLEWVRERPGAELSVGEVARIFAPEGGGEGRALRVIAVLTSGSVSIAEPFFKVRGTDGTLHAVGLVDREVWAGNRPYVIEQTGEIVERFDENAFPYIRFAEFEPSPPAPRGPA